MIENDTTKLLRECDAGAKMGISAIDDVLGHVKDNDLMQILKNSREAHMQLVSDIKSQLDMFHDDGKEPNPIAKGMSRMKTGMKLMANPGDGAVAELMTDGCHMGIKSLSRYLNQYAAADEKSKAVAKDLIHIEDELSVDMRDFL